MDDGHVRSPFMDEWRALEAMLDDGEPFANLEEIIETAALDEEERAALWLAGWAHASRCRRGSRPPEARAPRHLAALD